MLNGNTGSAFAAAQRKFTAAALAGATLACLLSSPASFAETFYKWKNADGVWSYGSHPPQGVEAVAVKTTAHKLSEAASADAGVEEGSAEAGAEGEQEGSSTEFIVSEEAKVSKAEKERLCKAAKTNLETLNSSAVIRKRDADGNVTVISDEERQAEIDNARQTIKDFC